MRSLALLAAGLLVGSLFAADDKKEDAKQEERKAKDEEAILGKWKVDKIEACGPDAKSPSAEKLAKSAMTFNKDGKLVTTNPDGGENEAVYKLDPAAKPKAVDVTRAGDKTAIPGIYELDGDTLKVCLNLAGSYRPAEFKGDDKGVIVFTLKRAKDEKKGK